MTQKHFRPTAAYEIILISLGIREPEKENKPHCMGGKFVFCAIWREELAGKRPNLRILKEHMKSRFSKH